MIQTLRHTANLSIEPLRAEGLIGSSLETKVTLCANEATLRPLQSMRLEDLERLLIVSAVELELNAALDANMITATAQKALGDKCGRCWRYEESVGQEPEHPTLCHRCHEVVLSLV